LTHKGDYAALLSGVSICVIARRAGDPTKRSRDHTASLYDLWIAGALRASR
jgi:hypothetical protein